MRPPLRRVALPALMIAFGAFPALSSGFHIYEQDAKASGQAVAFVARADDAAAIYYNPAAMTSFDGTVVAGGFSAVFLGETTFDSGESGKRWDMKNHTPIIAHLYYGQRIRDSRFALGVSYNNPFGLVTDWSQPGFDGRFAAVRTELRTHMVNVNGAIDLGQGWSVALGVDYLEADLRDFSKLSAVAREQPFKTSCEVFSNLTGDGHKFGWNAAAHFKTMGWAAGLTYRSGFKVKADGTATFAVGDIDVSQVPGPYQSSVSAGWVAAFPSGPATGTLKLPATIAAGVAYTGVPKWEFELDVHRLRWSEFDNIPVDFAVNTLAVQDKAVTENWKDTTSFRAGAAWDVGEQHQVRFGVYKENSPIPNSTLRPSIPDSARVGFTVGYGFHTARFAVDVYYMHIKLDNVTVSATDVDTNDPNDTARLGAYQSKIDLAGLTASYKF